MTKLSELPQPVRKEFLDMIELDIKFHKDLLDKAIEAQRSISDRIQYLKDLKAGKHSLENFAVLCQRSQSTYVVMMEG